jgi:drug/metabolite transporter superfamily protein YnfA
MLCLALVVAPGMAGKSAQAERYDVDLELQTDGSLRVTETLTFRYDGGPFTFVKREIPAAHTDGLQFLDAAMDGKPLPQGTDAGQVEVSGTDPMVVTWHFGPVSDSRHTFSLTYVALRVVATQDDAYVLSYKALPETHDYLILASTVKVHYPSGVKLKGGPTLLTGQAAIQITPGLVTFQSGELGADQILEIRLTFAPGGLTVTRSNWQSLDDRTQQQLPLFFLASGILAAVGGAGVGLFRWRFYPAAPSGIDSSAASPVLPSNLPPTLVGAVCDANSEPTANSILAMLFDLARRGVLKIEEQPPSQDFRVELVRQEGLSESERTLLEILFSTSALTNGMSASLMEAGPGLVAAWSTISAALTDELLMGGWVDPQRRKTRQTWANIPLIALALGVVAIFAVFFMSDMVGWGIFVFAGVFIALMLVWWRIVKGMVVLTDRGWAESKRWNSFREYLKQVSQGRETITRPDLFELYLPYATALGLLDAWAKFFKKSDFRAIPGWFQSFSPDSMDSMMLMVDPTPVSSSSDSSVIGDIAGSAGGGSSSTG